MDENKYNFEEVITVFGETNYRSRAHRFGIKTDDRRRHMYIVGKTGMGKTTLLQNMLVQDIKHGFGVAFIDPHGDPADELVNFVPSYRMNDVIYFNPADLENPIAFNILEQVDPRLRNVVADGLVNVFKKIWADSWGPRLEYILRNTILALLEYPNSTLLGVTRMLVEEPYRNEIVKNVTDPVVRSFWINEFANYQEKFRNEAIAPIQNKVGQFLSNSTIRNIVGQPKSSFSMEDVMNSGKIFIANLAKGAIGEDSSYLLGAMLVTKMQLAAMARVSIPEKERKDFIMYVDEFQNFATESFAGILSEARKYRLSLVVAHQYIEQLPEEVSAAIFGNVGTIIIFRVGAADAEILEQEVMPVFEQNDLVNLKFGEIYVKLMINGLASDTFSAKTLPPIGEPTGSREKIIRLTREQYANPLEIVADKISKWSNYQGVFEGSADAENRQAGGGKKGSKTAGDFGGQSGMAGAEKPKEKDDGIKVWVRRSEDERIHARESARRAGFKLESIEKSVAEAMLAQPDRFLPSVRKVLLPVEEKAQALMVTGVKRNLETQRRVQQQQARKVKQARYRRDINQQPPARKSLLGSITGRNQQSRGEGFGARRHQNANSKQNNKRHDRQNKIQRGGRNNSGHNRGQNDGHVHPGQSQKQPSHAENIALSLDEALKIGSRHFSGHKKDKK